jgi:hypothetical protein
MALRRPALESCRNGSAVTGHQSRGHVTGILAEYPHGAYDVALSEGRFAPSKAQDGTVDHVAAFSCPGLRYPTERRPSRSMTSGHAADRA